MAKLDGIPDATPDGASINHAEAAPNEAPMASDQPAPPGRARLMKTVEMVERGLLPVGTELTIKDRPNSTATVVDGRRVEFRGEVMSFNAWGCRVTGWPSIRIYTSAVLPDGRLLEALREQEIDAKNNKDEQ